MKANKQIEIEQDLTTNEITVEDILVEIIFKDELGNKHSRFIKLNSDCTDLTKLNIKEEMSKHQILKNFE